MTREIYYPEGSVGGVSQTPTQLLNNIKSVDGTGSGLDADTVDGHDVVQQGGGARDGVHAIQIGYTGVSPTLTVDGVDKGDIALTSDITNINPSKPTVTFAGGIGYNAWLIILNGKLYAASGNSTYIDRYSAGIGGNGPLSGYGLSNLIPVPSLPDLPIKQLTVARTRCTGVLFTNGDLYVWGYNVSGSCGLGHTAPVLAPVLAATGVEEVYTHPSNSAYSVDGIRTFIRKTDGKIYGAGYNGHGALGVGDTAVRTSFTEITALGINQVSKLFNLGSSSGCTVALTIDGRILACGYNAYGELGTGNTTQQNSFVDVTLAWAGVANGVLDLKVTGGFSFNTGTVYGDSHLVMMVTLPNSSVIVKSAGFNSHSQLGTGNTTTYNTPQTVLNLPAGIVDIATYSVLSNCALDSGGNLWTWGHNGQGQLGNGNTLDASTPAIVKTGVSKLLSNGFDNHTYGYRYPCLVLDTAGRLWGTGENTLGEVGIGTLTNVTTFTEILIPKGEQVVSIAGVESQQASGSFICLCQSGNIYAWGNNRTDLIIDSVSGDGVVKYPIYLELPNPV